MFFLVPHAALPHFKCHISVFTLNSFDIKTEQEFFLGKVVCELSWNLGSHFGEMYLPEVAQNVSISELWSSFAMNSRDNRTDNLPMMDFIAWPIGMYVKWLHTVFRSPEIFTQTYFISGIGSFDYFMWFCGYPIGYGLGDTLQRGLISNGKLGTVIIALYRFNVLVLGFTIIFFVSTSLLWNAGIHLSPFHKWKIVTIFFLFYR